MVAFPVVLPTSSKVMKDGGYTFGDFARYGGLIQVGAWVGMGGHGWAWVRLASDGSDGGLGLLRLDKSL